MEETPYFVYLITCFINGKWYVGKTGSTIQKRWKKHKEAAREGKKKYPLYHAMRKYGIENFEVQTLAVIETNEEASNLETIWIVLLDSVNRKFGYNLTLGGEGVRGLKLSEEHCKKISLRNTGKTAWNKGKPLTEEHKNALRVPKSSPSRKPGTEMRTDVPTLKLIRLYSEGLSCASIASLFNTTRSTVSWRLRKAGVKMRPVGRKQTKPKELIS
jgi:group I intron endonuclease